MDSSSIDRIDMELAEIDDLAQALIFITENTDEHQTDLLRHSAISICWAIHDKARKAGSLMRTK